jgi:RimJ/RimL family protein N-acetyltransferase
MRGLRGPHRCGLSGRPAGRRDASRCIGELGFGEFRRGRHPEVKGLPEPGWVLASAARGNACATEGLRAVVAWGDRHVGERRTVCIIDRDDGRSLSVAAKPGSVALPAGTTSEAADIVLVRAPHAA